MIDVQLQPGVPGLTRLGLRPLTGHDEILVGRAGRRPALMLLDRLATDSRGEPVPSGTAWRLPLSDVDRLLARLYASVFEDRIESNVPCRTCEKPFQLQFSLSEVASRALTPDTAGLDGPEAHDCHHYYRLATGVQFRLPTAADQLEVEALSPEKAAVELLRRCVDHDAPGSALLEVEKAMERVGPVLRLELDADCPDCGTKQFVRFDVEEFLVKALLRERRWLLREVHSLAVAYRWSPGDILSLSREERQVFVALVQAARAPRQESLFS